MAVVTVSDKLEPAPPVVPLDEDLQLLRMKDVVAITTYSRTKVYHLVNSGELPHVGSGRSVRVKLTDLRDWIARNHSSFTASHTSATSSSVR